MSRLGTIGFFALLFFIACYPFMAFSDYTHAQERKTYALLGCILISLLTLTAVIGGLLTITGRIPLRSTTMVTGVPFDLALAIYWWTSPSKKWAERRHHRLFRLFLIGGAGLILITLILLLVGFFV